jgi:hypothetical protein
LPPTVKFIVSDPIATTSVPSSGPVASQVFESLLLNKFCIWTPPSYNGSTMLSLIVETSTEKFCGGVPTLIAKADQLPDEVTIKLDVGKTSGWAAISKVCDEGTLCVKSSLFADEDWMNEEEHLGSI